MKKPLIAASAALLVAVFSLSTLHSQENEMSFFITSAGSGDGANLGGLAGADAHCASLAEAAGSNGKTWRAYLSAHASDGSPAVNARDRIGFGPWYNANGVEVASNINNLHGPSNNLNKQTALTENGDIVNGRGDDPNQHDILTGSTLDGRTVDDGANHTLQQLDGQRRRIRPRRTFRPHRRRPEPHFLEQRTWLKGLQPG